MSEFEASPPVSLWSRLVPLIGLMSSGITIGALLLAYVSAGEIYDYNDTMDGVHLPAVDVIVCLAGGRGRISAAGDLWYRYREQAGPGGAAPLLYISGMGHQSDWGTFARQLRKGVQTAIRPTDVILENESQNTEANARYFVRMARQKKWGRLLLVTSRYHMRRSRMMFDRVLRISGHPMEIETSSVFQEPFEPGEWRTQVNGVQVTLTEYVKWLFYRTLWRPRPEGPLSKV